MEKLHSDMLEMILSQPIKRLNERQTKFLIFQVGNLCFYFFQVVLQFEIIRYLLR
jgi:hypothetical protein